MRNMQTPVMEVDFGMKRMRMLLCTNVHIMKPTTENNNKTIPYVPIPRFKSPDV
jgi:hypothetical protein